MKFSGDGFRFQFLINLNLNGIRKRLNLCAVISACCRISYYFFSFCIPPFLLYCQFCRKTVGDCGYLSGRCCRFAVCDCVTIRYGLLYDIVIVIVFTITIGKVRPCILPQHTLICLLAECHFIVDHRKCDLLCWVIIKCNCNLTAGNFCSIKCYILIAMRFCNTFWQTGYALYVLIKCQDCRATLLYQLYLIVGFDVITGKHTIHRSSCRNLTKLLIRKVGTGRLHKHHRQCIVAVILVSVLPDLLYDCIRCIRADVRIDDFENTRTVFDNSIRLRW